MDRKNISRKNTVEIDKNFKTFFSELEKRHVEIRSKVNFFSTNGRELEEKLSEEIKSYEPWRLDIMNQLSAITSDFDDEQIKAYHKFIQDSKYYEIVQEAPFYWRIINKPNGYAGDAEMMSFIYRNQFEGETPFGMFLHKHAVNTKACQAVRNRKTYLTEQIIKTNGGRILSLAAGPAQEIQEILDHNKQNGFQFLALDHDLATIQECNITQKTPQFAYALANAFQIISGQYQVARPRSHMMKHCYPRRDFRGFRRLFASLKYDLIDLKKEEFDLVYTAGLYDYIKTYPLDDSKGTVALTKNLFDLVKTGGSLIIGNFNQNNPEDLKFVMAYIYDWQLLHRDKHDMMEFARTIDELDIKDIQVVEEPLGINYFLKIDKN